MLPVSYHKGEYAVSGLIGKFPVFVLNLAVEPAQVDVNVHPAKLEVRFKNDDEVYEFFYNAVAKALQETVLIPKAVLEKKPKERLPQAEQYFCFLFQACSFFFTTLEINLCLADLSKC